MTGYEKMGHPEKLSEMPFLVPFDSAFFSGYFDIFVLFLRRRIFAQTRRLPCAAGRGQFENADRNQSPYNSPVYASRAFAGKFTRAHSRAREDTWRIFFGEDAFRASSVCSYANAAILQRKQESGGG